MVRVRARQHQLVLVPSEACNFLQFSWVSWARGRALESFGRVGGPTAKMTNKLEAKVELQRESQKPKTHKPECVCWRCRRRLVPNTCGIMKRAGQRKFLQK